jgi:Ca2+-binding RTX toxin-like protein
VFQFNQNPIAIHRDQIIDFNVAEGDRICFVKTPVAYAALGPSGAVSEQAFWIGTAAHDNDDRIIYDAQRGVLLYDADGTGSAIAREITTLGTNLNLTHQSFFIL